MPTGVYDPKILFETAGVPLTEQENALLGRIGHQGDVSYQIDVTLYSTKVLKEALNEHANALIKASDASDRNARSLTRATWFLSVATFALVLAAIAQVVVILVKP